MKAYTTDVALSDLDADLVAVGLFEGEELSEPLGSTAGASDASGDFKSQIIVYPGKPERVVIIGLGKKEDFTAEKARVVGAVSQRALKQVKGEVIAWMLPETPEGVEPGRIAAALVEGAGLAAFEFDRYKSGSDGQEAPPSLKAVEINTDLDLGDMVRVGEVVANSGNRARYLQSLPANEATPEYLAGRAREIADAYEKVSVDVMDREQIIAAGMGGLEAVSKGGEHVEPRLITLKYHGGGDGETLGLIGKSVTFDTGGISIKPSAGMHEMKMDMSGGAAVLEAMGAIAELDLPINIIAVLPSTENMPSGTALKPGDIITQLNGKTVEVTNTDAEGRLILADALVHCAREGADRMVDLATLTGAVLIGLGSTYAALISNDDDLAASVTEAGQRTGELVWRLPLHEEYKDLTKGEITDLVNASAQRKAGTIYAGSFLEEFTEGKPWAHVDIAGTAWDTGREYWGKGPTGFGVHLLVALARDLSA
ncbi:MAG: leucyl aminopeptidase [Solirubrobacterales bacterium]|nr:leucyl aminopeptidase [Solirubrobacterales bacterium]